MAIDRVSNEFTKITRAQTADVQQSGKTALPIRIGGNWAQASRQISKADIQKAMNEPDPKRAVQGLLEKSPVNSGQELSKEDIEKMGYSFYTITTNGSPVVYKSADGGTITVYNGKAPAQNGEYVHKTVYEKDGIVQEMYYDNNGNLTGGKINLKDSKMSDGIMWHDFRTFNFEMEGRRLKVHEEPRAATN